MAQFPPQGGPSSGPVQNYPARRGPGPYVTLDSIREAWEILQQDMTTWVVCSLILLIGSQAIQTPINFFVQTMVLGDPFSRKTPDLSMILTLYAILIPISLLTQPLFMILQAGMVDMAVRRQEGFAIAIPDMFLGFKKFGKLYAASFLQLLAIMFGSIFCWVPGLYAMGTLAFTPMYVLRQDLGPTDAMQASYNTLKSQAWMMVGVTLLAGICTMLGLLACCVGILVTLPLYSIVIGINYYNFHQPPILSPIAPEGFSPYPRGGVQPGGFVPGQPSAPEVPQQPEVPQMPPMPEPPEIPGS